MEELLNILSKFDEVQILELLEITTDELLEAFSDRLEERLEELLEKVQ